MKKLEEEKSKKFNLLKLLQSFVQPSIYRRMEVILQESSDEEHFLLLRWSGSVDIDSNILLNLINDRSS